MLEQEEYVEVKNGEGGITFRFNCSYPQTVCVLLANEALNRLGQMFIALGKGKKRAEWKAETKSGSVCFEFHISAKRKKASEKPQICFGYSFFNRELERVSDMNIYFDCYGNTSLLRFGKELLSLNDGDVAVLCE